MFLNFLIIDFIRFPGEYRKSPGIFEESRGKPRGFPRGIPVIFPIPRSPVLRIFQGFPNTKLKKYSYGSFSKYEVKKRA